MKKKVFVILATIDAIIFIITLMYYQKYTIYYILLNIIVAIIFMKVYYKIDVINVNKIVNMTKAKRIRDNISKDEKYLEKITIKTFDGSNGTMHPCIIKFDKLLNKYKYYMVHTPYDNYNIELENPSVCISNDGINFVSLSGANDPLLPIIKGNGKIKKYYSDNFALSDGDFQIWYRYTEEKVTSKSHTLLKNQIYRIVSKDGVKYTEPELMIDDDGIWYMSPSIIKIDSLYYLYYFDKDLKIYCKTSKDLHKWNKEVCVNIKQYNGNFWHGEVKMIKDKLYMLFLSKDYKLYLCESNLNSPYEFYNCNELIFNYYDKCNIYGYAHPYKSSFLIDNDYICFYIPYVVNKINWFKIKGIKHAKWTMTYTKLSINSFNKYIKRNNIDKAVRK